MFAAGFYTYSIFALIFWETKRADWGVSMSHHVATAILIMLSYIFRFVSDLNGFLSGLMISIIYLFVFQLSVINTVFQVACAFKSYFNLVLKQILCECWCVSPSLFPIIIFISFCMWFAMKIKHLFHFMAQALAILEMLVFVFASYLLT